MKTSPGFTTTELVVALAVVAVLVWLAVPAVSSTLGVGPMTKALGNMRQLHFATQQYELNRLTAGDTNSAWPGSNGPANWAEWAFKLTNGSDPCLTPADLRGLLSVPGIHPPVAFNASNAPFNMYQVGNVKEASAIFLSTRNWNAAAPAMPSDNKAFILLHKGGAGMIFRPSFATNIALTVITTNQPPLVP